MENTFPFYILFLFFNHNDIYYYISFRYIAQWYDIYITYKVKKMHFLKERAIHSL